MGIPEVPETTDPQKILTAVAEVSAKVDTLIGVLNGLGANQQWIVDNVSDIFRMFKSPMFTTTMGQMMTGALSHAGPADPSPSGPAADGPTG